MTCALCHKEKELNNSHIIPEFFYKPLYDEKHRFNVVALSKDEKQRYVQKGLRERLLCEMCELQLSQYEDHVRRVFYGGTGIYITNGNPTKIEGIDYQKFKLFQLSVLWRASVSTLDFFHNISLGPHEETIRQMLVKEDPGERLKYPCSIFMMLMEGKELVDAFIHPPQEMKIDGHYAFRFIFGGAFWVYFVSSHTHMLQHKEFFLSEKGELLIPLRKAEETEFFLELAKNIVKHNKI